IESQVALACRRPFRRLVVSLVLSQRDKVSRSNRAKRLALREPERSSGSESGDRVGLWFAARGVSQRGGASRCGSGSAARDQAIGRGRIRPSRLPVAKPDLEQARATWFTGLRRRLRSRRRPSFRQTDRTTFPAVRPSRTFPTGSPTAGQA